MSYLARLQRIMHKPPKVILERIGAEIRVELERFLAPQRARTFKLDALLRATNKSSLSELWSALGVRPYPATFEFAAVSHYDQLCHQDSARIFVQAQQALEHKVNLLGSSVIALGEKINWHKDYKSGFDWPPAYIRSINYNNPERPSDVKFPWEVSRMQWMIPLGQAYLLTQDEKYAQAVKEILLDWIENNPYAASVNWACTMEVALRILSWTWFFHVFKNSVAWQEENFREKFLCSLFMHADFTARHLEKSDINGNHYTADAAGLVFAGLFFAEGDAAKRWQVLGWEILCDELPKQVFADGVDFEASVPYHRLVLELFFLPALYRQVCHLEVPHFYRERVTAMARFTAAYSRENGSVPLWGDADDARALPFGNQAINDHRYLCGLVGYVWQEKDLLQAFNGSTSEIYWLLGEKAVHAVQSVDRENRVIESSAFPEGGFYIMRNALDHVFIDCGPLGLAGRGGHGHNDCLSFEAILNGEHIISDCGAYVYTASYQERNNFRSTSYHNTPQIDGIEINRFVSNNEIWMLHNDALPRLEHWEVNAQQTILAGAHNAYEKLSVPVYWHRKFILDHQLHQLTIEDEFKSDGEHQIIIPFHLAPQVKVVQQNSDNSLLLEVNEKSFSFSWKSDMQWDVQIQEARISPSYGVIIPTKKIILQAKNIKETKMIVCIK